MFDPEGPTLIELTRQALASTTRGYDMLAPKFEHTPFRTPDALLGPMMEEIGGPGSIDAALDACCGTGAAMSHLRALCRDRVVGTDLSEGMLEQARALVEASPGEAAVELHQLDTLEMEFDAEFDVVTCCGAFGHILPPQQDRFLGRVRAALKPGGRFVFITAPMPSPTEPVWWAARGFNAVMHVRNAVKKPPFIMFYLTFPLERASELLWAHGFDVSVTAPYGDTPYPRARLVVATKR
jgi:SAM-dependent methyltransferase